MTESWRCKKCWKVLSGKHVHCPHCGGKWTKVQDTTFVPPEQREQSRTTTRGRPAHGRGERQTHWNWDEADYRSMSRSASNHSSKSAQPQRQGRGRRRNNRPRGNKQRDPPYSALALPPPWKADESLAADAATSSTTAVQAELVKELRDAFPDEDEMPEGVRKMMEKYDPQSGRQLTSAMHKATKALGKSRDNLKKFQEARTKHRSRWLVHLKALMETLSQQVDAFEKQQKDYTTKILDMQRSIQATRRDLQKLNVQAAADNKLEIPSTLAEDEHNMDQVVDVEEDSLRAQVQDLLNKCLKHSKPRRCRGDSQRWRGDGHQHRALKQASTLYRTIWFCWQVIVGSDSVCLRKTVHEPLTSFAKDAPCQVEAYDRNYAGCAACLDRGYEPWLIHSCTFTEDNWTFPFMALHQAYLLAQQCNSWTPLHDDSHQVFDQTALPETLISCIRQSCPTSKLSVERLTHRAVNFFLHALIFTSLPRMRSLILAFWLFLMMNYNIGLTNLGASVELLSDPAIAVLLMNTVGPLLSDSQLNSTDYHSQAYQMVFWPPNLHLYRILRLRSIKQVVLTHVHLNAHMKSSRGTFMDMM